MVKLADFGLSKKKENVNGTVLGTCEYMSPELLRGDQYGFEVDMWSFGVLFYFMLNAEPPFSSNLFIKISTRVGRRKGRLTNSKKWQLNLVLRRQLLGARRREWKIVCLKWKICSAAFSKWTEKRG